MTRSQALLEEVESLPLGERVQLVDRILRSLHGATPENDRRWLAEARRRLRDIRSGRLKAIPGSDVLAEGRRRLR